jgi:putative heme iron utilization protein
MVSVETRQLLLHSYQGVLSTHSQYMVGYPFGSVVPFCLDGDGHVIILISDLAQHTKNLKADAHCSLLVLGEGDDVQTAARLTIMANAQAVANTELDAIAQRYYRYFPQSRDFHRVHDFHFWRLTAVKYRYIGGFGRIHWAEPSLLANPFFGDSEADMVQHMNEDHADALPLYCQLAQIPMPESATIMMVGVDSEGFHLRVNERLVYITFPHTVHTPQQVRETLVMMLKAARAGVKTP